MFTPNGKRHVNAASRNSLEIQAHKTKNSLEENLYEY